MALTIRGYELLELLEPVLHDPDPIGNGARVASDHEEPLPVGRDLVVRLEEEHRPQTRRRRDGDSVQRGGGPIFAGRPFLGLCFRTTRADTRSTFNPIPAPGNKFPISTSGGTEPVWSRDGKELFFRHGDEMMAVAIELQGAFSAGAPRLAFGRQRPDVVAGIWAHLDKSQGPAREGDGLREMVSLCFQQYLRLPPSRRHERRTGSRHRYDWRRK